MADQPMTRVRVTGPADMLAAVPRMLGFHPADSLVIIGVAGPRHQAEIGFRYDLPDDDAQRRAVAEHAMGIMAARKQDICVVIGYGPGERVTPVVDALRELAGTIGFPVHEALRVEGGRYWSYLCENPECCPPEGVPFDVEVNAVAATLAVAGLTAAPDRAAAEQRVAAPTGDAFVEAQALARRTLRGLDELPPAIRLEVGLDIAKTAITTYQVGEPMVSEGWETFLAISLGDLRVRDDAWARMVPEHREAHLRLWTDVVTRVDPILVPPAASLMAFVAWQTGDGGLASMALERALSVQPDYSMANLLAECLAAGVPPSQATLPMTPEDVAESYAKQERDKR